MEKQTKMAFKSIIVWPIIRPGEHYTRKELRCLRQEIKNEFSEYGTASCMYYSPVHEPTMHGYQGNFAIVDFKRKQQARKALRAVEKGQVCINKTKVVGKAVPLYYSPVARISDECLLIIFTYLSVYEQLKLHKICKRWRRASEYLWRNVTKIDLRQKDAIYKDKNYIINSGAQLKDIYCYDDYGLKIIGKYCPNVENVAVEFRKYMRKNNFDRTCITFEVEILPRFRHLTRLMLKIRKNQYSYFTFLCHLPETMAEIHLSNDINMRVISVYDTYGARISNDFHNYGRKLLDLSRFINLHALTLKGYIFDESSLVGLEKLKKLSCLCLDNCMFSQTCIDQLKSFTNLKHLSLKRVELYYNDAWTLLTRNQNLNYLALPLMIDRMYFNQIWLDAVKLRQLKTLCWAHVGCKIKNVGESTIIENIELHDVNISNRRIRFIINNFPNLNILKGSIYGDLGSNYLTSSVQHSILERPNKNPFTFYSGKLLRNRNEWYLPPPNYSKENFHHFEEVSPEDGKLFRCDDWHGWYIDDDKLKPDQVEQNHFISSPQHNSPSNLDISQLSDAHLTKIFSYLLIDNKLNCSKVCKRWQRIIKEQSKGFVKFDVRQLFTHSQKIKCLRKYGKHFEDIFSYRSCGFVPLMQYCPNVKNLAIDFGVKKCDCKPSGKDFYSMISLGLILESFRHLTRLMIRDVTAFIHNGFNYLPDSLEELHVFNRNPRPISATGKDEKMQRRNIVIDLCQLKKMRALTFVQANLPVDEIYDESVAITGLENMKYLVHLKLSGDIFIINPDSLIQHPLPLEYLSLTQSTISSGTLAFLIKYENIQYLDIADSFMEIEKNHLSAILRLERLKIFRMATMSPDMQEVEEQEWEFDFIPTLPHLEILDCQGHPKLLKRLVESAIVSSRNLKLVNVPVSTVNDITELLTIAESAMMSKNNSALLNIFVGIKGYQICNNWRLSATGVRLRDIPPFEYYKLLGKLFWCDWSTKEGSTNVDAICRNLIKSVD